MSTADAARAGATIRPFLELSTGALRVSTRNFLQASLQSDVDDTRLPGDPVLTGAPTRHGYFVHVPVDHDTDTVRTDNVPGDLGACFAKAHELGCEYILFDADADTDYEALGLVNHEP